jgi:predicted porin
MNKKLIALAVAGACVAPSVMAQSANPVTLYGRAYITVESVEADGGPAGTADLSNRVRMMDQASLLGVRGTEDLGGGLKAFFQLETAFNPDESSGSFANRNSGVGLMGGWGSLLAGRWDTPMKSAITATDPWGDLTINDVNGVTMDQSNFSRRQANMVQYWSPEMSGFQVKVGYVPNEGKTATANPSLTGVALTYSKGPLYLALAYEEHKDNIASSGAAGTPGKEDGYALAARFTMGKARLMGSYGEYDKSNGQTDKSYHVGFDWNFAGKHVLLGTYSNAEQASADCDAYAVGYRYDYTKRTFFIAAYTEIDNSNGMNCNFGNGSFGSAGQDLTGFTLGLRHVF